MWWLVALALGLAVGALFFIDQFEFFIPDDEELSNEESR